MAFFLQIVPRHTHDAVLDAVHANALLAVVCRRNEPNLKIGWIGPHQALKHQGQLLLVSRGCFPKRSQCGGVITQHLQVAGYLFAVERDAAGQYLGGGQQFFLGGLHQKVTAGLVGVKAGQARSQDTDAGQQPTELERDADLHGASTLLARSPAKMRSHSLLRRSTSSTGSSHFSRSCVRKLGDSAVVVARPWRLCSALPGWGSKK